jgi:hypothetical protein
MARTTPEAVGEVLGEDWDGLRSLTPFIDTAALLVTRVATCAVQRGTPLGVEELEIIERWLSAHFYTMSDKALVSKNSADAGGAFHGQTAMYLEASLYGQTAVGFDITGCLLSLTKPQTKSVGAFWLGKPPSSQIDYEDRR